MVDVVTGSAAGLASTSRMVIGAAGQFGTPNIGRAGEQVTLNGATGNLVVQNRDELLFGAGPDVELLRTYNSQGAWDGDNADNWRIGYYRRVTGLTGTLNAAGSSIRRLEADGFESTYSYNGSAYVSTDGAGAYDTLSFNATTALWTWTDGDTGVTETYAETAAGSGNFRLAQVTDVEGHSVRIAYGSGELISTVSTWKAGASAADETLTLSYDNSTSRRLTQITSTVIGSSGSPVTRTRVRYEYDSLGRLAAVRTDLSPEDGSVADGRVYAVQYGYNANGWLASISQTDGTSLAIEYDASGRVSRLTDALSRVTTIGYDTANRRTTITDPLSQATVLSYDAAGRLLQATGAAMGGAAFTQSYTYSANGDLATVRDGLGRETVFAYNANGDLVRRTDAAGNVLERSFDSANRLTAETLYTVPDPDGAAGAALPSGAQRTLYVYDTTAGRRRLAYSLSPEGRVTQYGYNTLGQRSTSTVFTNNSYTATPTPSLAELNTWTAGLSAADRALAQRSEYGYDLRGQLVSVRQYANATVNGSDVVYAGASEQRSVYDAFGRLLQSIDGNGNASVQTYDGLDRVATRQDAGGALTVYTYDDAGRRTSVQLANGLTTLQTFDAAGNLVSTAQSQGGPTLSETRYFFDANDRLRMTQDPTGLRTWIYYDAAGRKVADVDATGRYVEYAYDGAGRLVQTVQFATLLSAATLATLVDAGGRPTERTLAQLRPAANTATDRVTTRYFDAAGRLVGVQDADGYLTETQYDGAGRAVATLAYATAGSIVRVNTATSSTTATPPAMVRPASDADDRRTRNLYGNDGLLRGTLDAEGYLVELRYDAAGRLVERIAYANTTDPAQRSAGTLAQLLPAAHAADRRSVNLYDGKGQFVGEVDAEGYLTEHVYDDAGNRTQTLRYARSVTAAVSTTSSLASLRPASSSADVTTRWDYDALNRVSLQTASDGTLTQTVYDNVGNRISTIQAVGQPEVRTLSVRYDAQGRLTAELSAEGAALLTGGQTQAQIDAIWQNWGSSYGYDAAGRRISARDARGNVTVYYYDAAGRRVYTVLKTPQGGEVQQASYNSFGDVEGTVTYAARLSVADTAGLTGGLADATLASRVAALADTARDLRSTAVFGRRSQVHQAIDALGNSSAYGYDAFGEVVVRLVDQGDGRSQSTYFGFDRRGLLLSSTLDGGGMNLRSSTEYDAFGRVTASVDARGRRTTYAYTKNDGTPDGGRQVAVTDPANVVHRTTYDAFDRVLRQTDAFGNSVRYTHDAAARRMTVVTAEGIQTVTETSRHGQVVRVTDGTGAVTSYAYDRNGKLLTTTDAAGNVTQNSYDAVGNLTATTVGLRSNAGAAPSNDGSASSTTFSYDAANRLLVKTVDPGGLALQTTYEYDGRGRAVRVTDAAGVVTSYAFDAKGQLTDAIVDDVTGGLRLRTTYTYDAEGRTRTVVEGAGTAAAKTTEYRYDVLGRRTQEIVDPAGLALTSTYEYDAIGNVVLKRDPLGHGTRYVYDAVGRLKYTIDALGSVVQRLYDAEGRLTGSKSYTQRLAGSPPNLSTTALSDAQIETAVAGFSNAADQLTQWVYDRDGRQVYAIDAEGGVSQSRYDAAGRVIETIRYATRRPGVWAAGTTPTVDAARDQSTLTVYDAIGRARYSVDALNFVTESTYDRVGRVIATKRYAQSITRPATATETSVAAAIAGRLDAAKDRTDYSVYDNAGRLRFSVDAEGYATERSYDALGRVTSTFKHDAKLNFATPPTLAQVSAATQFIYRFDTSLAGFNTNGGGVWEAGAVKMISQAVPDSSWGYVQSSRIVAPGATVKFDLTPNSFQNDLHVGVERGSGSNCRLMAILRPDGRLWANTYDSQGNSRTVDIGSYAPGTTYTVEVTTNARGATLYFYVKGGNRDAGYIYRSPTDFVWPSVITRFYSKRTSTLTTQTTAIIDNVEERSGTLTSNRYDAAGRLTHSVDAEGTVTKYSYDASGRLTDTTEAFGRPEATTTHRVYDQAGRLVEETAGYGSSTVSVTRYRYDANGRLVAKVDPRAVALAEGTDTWSTSERPVLGYPASAASLTAAQREALLDRYTTSYAYDALGQRTGVTDALGRTTTTVYDAFGCAVQTTDARGYVSYAYYDLLNRKIQDVDAERYLTATAYDAFGNATDTVRYDAKVAGTLMTGSSIVVGSANPNNGRAYVIVAATKDAADHSEFDRNNRLLWQRDAEGYVEGSNVVALDAFGQRVSVTNKLGAVATYTYDRLGRVITETLPVTAANASGVQVPVVNRSQYDSRGNRTQLIEAEGLPEQRITLYTFDSVDRLVRTLRPAYQAVDSAGATSTVNPVDELRYDAFGNVVEQIVSGNLVNNFATGGKRSLAYYDTLKRRTVEVSADAVLARYTYDPAGNVVMHTIFATRLASLPATAGGTPPTVATNANDRTLSYLYDALGRKTETRLDGVWSWEEGEPLSVPAAQRITVERLGYDAMGNVTQRTDARGNATYQYFDGLGRKVLVIDPEGYGTALWYARAFSTVTSETRYAGRLTTPVTRQTDTGATDTQVFDVRLAVTNATNAMPAAQAEPNRATNFALDRLGRVTQRQLIGVQFDHVQSDGTLVRSTADALTRYVYDGLGHVTQTSERTAVLAGNVSVWEVTDIGYDGLGRETSRLAPGFTDQDGTAVRPRTEQVYDGLGNMVRRTQRGKDGTTEADDRIFLFSYSGDRLIQETDAEGAVTRYDHDALGEVSRRTAVAVRRSDGSTRDLVTTYQVDAAGRIIVETDLDTGLVKKTRYNAFGEVSAKGTGDGWQEFAEYTTLGKVWKTNSGDGAVKIYLQDKTGNTTREIRAGGTVDLRNTTLAAASGDATLFHTISVYDERGQLERTIEPRIELQTSGVALSQMFTEQWVPQYGDLNVTESAGGNYQTASVGQGQAYTTVTTSTGTQTATGAAVPTLVSATDGVALGPAPSSSDAPSGGILRWSEIAIGGTSATATGGNATYANSAATSRQRSFQIPSNWAAGLYRIVDTVGTTTTVTTASAQPGSTVYFGGGGQGTHTLGIEWQGAGDQPWISVAVGTYSKSWDLEGEPMSPYAAYIWWSPVTFSYQSAHVMAFDMLDAGWNGAANFQVTINPEGGNPNGITAWQWLPSTTRYRIVTIPAMTGQQVIRIVGQGADGTAKSGHDYILQGSDLTTLSANAPTQKLGSQGTAFAFHASNTRQLVGTPGAGTFYYRPYVAGGRGAWTSRSYTTAVDLTNVSLSNVTYEYVFEQAGSLRYGRFTVNGRSLILDNGGVMRQITRNSEQITLAGSPNGSVTLKVNGFTATATANASGIATFDLGAIRQTNLGVGLWSAGTASYEYVARDTSGKVTHSDRGTVTFGSLIDPASEPSSNNAALAADGVTEYLGEGIINIAGAAGTVTLTPAGGTAVTYTIGSSDYHLRQSGSQLIVNLRDWIPAWNGAAKSVAFQYNGSNGLVANGNFTISYTGAVAPSGTVTQRTNQPILPLTVTGAATMSVFNVGTTDTTLASALGEISGTGPNFSWNASNRLGQTRRYYFEARDSSGRVVGAGRGTVVINANGSITHTPDAPAAFMRFSPPANTSSFELQIRPKNSTGAYTTYTNFTLEGNVRLFNAEALVPDSGFFEYDYIFTARDAANVTLTRGTGTLRVESTGATSSTNLEELRPSYVYFKISGRNVPRAGLSVTGNGVTTTPTLTGTWVPAVINADGSPGTPGYTRFTWDGAQLGSTSGALTYDYVLTAQSSTGATLTDEIGRAITQSGRVVLDPAGAQPAQLQQLVSALTLDSNILVTRHQVHNAFGEVVEERDDRVADRMKAMLGLAPTATLTAAQDAAARTTLRYNTLGQLISKTDPETHITLANGHRYRDRPVTLYGYDLVGRSTTTTDANGNLNKQSLLAGTRGDHALAQAEFFADSGVRRTSYDVFGDARRVVDQENNTDLRNYDKMSRLVQADHLGIQRVNSNGVRGAAQTLTERYTYDQLGQRLSQTNAAGFTSRQDYDGQGRVTSTVSAQGFQTRYQYDIRAAGATSDGVTGLGTDNIGGTKRTTFQADGRTLIDKIDYFGHTTWHQDLSGAQYTYSYDRGARLVSQTSTVHAGQTLGQNIAYTYYANGYIKSMTDNAVGTVSEYGYDNAGNRVYEGYFQLTNGSKNGSYQAATITYDELNRTARIRDNSYFDINYEYDANSNRRMVDSVYWDGVAGLRDRQTYWYAYDALNRFTVTKGELSGARATTRTDTSVTVRAGAEGTALGYDKLSRRVSATYMYNGSQVLETYGYSQDGLLETTSQGGVLKAVRVLDSLGRTTSYHIKNSANVNNNYEDSSTHTTYDRDNRILRTEYWDIDGTKNHAVDYSYFNDATDSQNSISGGGSGALARTVLTPHSSAGPSPTVITTTYTYTYWDDAKQASVVKTAVNSNAPNWFPGSTTITYNANGHLKTNRDNVAGITTTYFNNAQGLVLKRERQQGSSRVGSHFYYYADGKRVGDVSDDPSDNTRISYAEALATKNATPVDKRELYRNFRPVTSADFDQNFEPINESYPGPVPGSYTVREGDNLQLIAQNLWGDRSLWFLIADANGLSGTETLQAGRVLTIPNQVTNIHNNATTFRPYDAGEAMGSIDPTLPPAPPPPQRDKGCGTFLMIVIAVVVACVVGPEAVSFFQGLGGAAAGAGAGAGTAAAGASAAAAGAGALSTAAGFAVGAAAGSIASQAVGLAMGTIDSFSWKAVGQAALGGAIGGAVSTLNIPGLNVSYAAAAKAAIGTGIAQALHGDWNWTAVLASALGAGVGAKVGQWAGGKEWGSALNGLGRNIAAGLAGGVAAVAVAGGRARYDSVFVSTLGSAIGNALGSSLADAASRPSQTEQPSTVGPISAEERASILDLFKDGPNGAPASTYTGGQAWAADVAARRADAKARQIDDLMASVGSGGVSVDSRPGVIYVQPGDNLTKIGARWSEYGSANDLKNQLIAANPQLSDPNNLPVGMALNFPDAGTVVDRAALARAVGADGRYQAALAARAQPAAVAWGDGLSFDGLSFADLALGGGSPSLGGSTSLSGMQRAQAHALGVYDAGAGAVEGAGYSFGVVGTPESRAAWAVKTAEATVEGIRRFANDPKGAMSGWWDNLTGDDPEAIRQATAQGAGVAIGVAGGVATGRLQGGLRVGTASELDMFRRVANQGAFADLPVLMDLKTVRSYASEAGIGLDGVKVRIVRDESLIGRGIGGYTHPNGKSIDLYPDAFSSPEELVRTIAHERMHVYQARTFGEPTGQIDLRLNENAAYGLEDSFVQYWRLNKGR